MCFVYFVANHPSRPLRVSVPSASSVFKFLLFTAVPFAPRFLVGQSDAACPEWQECRTGGRTIFQLAQFLVLNSPINSVMVTCVHLFLADALRTQLQIDRRHVAATEPPQANRARVSLPLSTRKPETTNNPHNRNSQLVQRPHNILCYLTSTTLLATLFATTPSAVQQKPTIRNTPQGRCTQTVLHELIQRPTAAGRWLFGPKLEPAGGPCRDPAALYNRSE